MYKGYKLLTNKERKHLSEQKVVSTFDLVTTFKHQAALRETYPDIEPCWDCKFIAQKLGYKI
jgi:hypothetical protein